MLDIDDKTKMLERTMANCYGTENYYVAGHLAFKYTDGVKTFCETAAARGPAPGTRSAAQALFLYAGGRPICRGALLRLPDYAGARGALPQPAAHAAPHALVPRALLGLRV